MTRKHFNAIARALAQSYAHAIDAKSRDAIENTIGRLASEFEQFNKNFDRARFVAACKGSARK